MTDTPKPPTSPQGARGDITNNPTIDTGAQLPPAAPAAAPAKKRQKVGPYEILGQIAQGGMGVVYRVRDPKLGREVALKMLIGGAWTSGDMQKRFLREAHILADLSHPGIVAIHAIGVEEGVPYYTMELVRGETLNRYLKSSQLPLPQKLRIFLMCCEAVHYAHMKGVIHRDLKPANILVTPDHRPVVLDFGIAHLAETDVSAQMTQSGIVMGTPAYMSPEQAQGRSREVDVRTDVYALGIILYEMATGRTPFQADDSYTLMKAVIEEAPPRPSILTAGISGDLEAVILKAIHKEADKRYVSAHALAEDLKNYLAGKVVEALPDTPTYRLRKWVLRHRELTFSVTGAALVLACLGTWSIARVYQGGREAQAARLRAEEALGTAQAERDKAEQAKKSAQAERDKAVAAEQKATAAFQRMQEEQARREAVESEQKEEKQRRERRSQAERFLEMADRSPKPVEALKACDRALETDPTCVQAHQKRGGVLQALGRPEEALKAYDQALDLDPSYAQAQERRGGILLALGKPTEALAAFDQALAIDPAYALAQLDRAQAFQALKQPEEALQACDRALAVDPSFVQAQVQRGLLLASQGKTQEALKALEKGLELDPRNLPALEARAGLLLTLGNDRLDEALKSFDALLEMDPARAAFHCGRGIALQRKGKLVETLKAFDRALELDPRCVQAYLHRGIFQQTQGRLEEALKSFDQAIAIDPRQARALAGRGTVLLKQAKHEEAVEALKRATALDPTQAQDFFTLGKAFQAVDRPQEAAEAYRTALDLGLPPGADLEACKSRLESMLQKSAPH